MAGAASCGCERSVAIYIMIEIAKECDFMGSIGRGIDRPGHPTVPWVEENPTRAGGNDTRWGGIAAGIKEILLAPEEILLVPTKILFAPDEILLAAQESGLGGKKWLLSPFNPFFR